MRTTREYRLNVAALEVRAGAEGKGSVLAGHAAVFNRSTDLGYFIETVKPGAFKRTLGEDDIRALWNHDSNFVLGRNRAGTLTLSEDPQGLAVEIQLNDNQLMRDMVVAPIQRGDVTGMSFAFEVREQVTRIENDVYYRDLTDVRLWEVSPVTFPAYEQTDIAVRSFEEIAKTFRRGPETPTSEEEALRAFHERRRQLQLAVL